MRKAAEFCLAYTMLLEIWANIQQSGDFAQSRNPDSSSR